MMRVARGHERLVEHEVRLREARLEVTVRPLEHGLAGRELAFFRARKVAGGPFRGLEPRRAAQTVVDDVAVAARVRSARIQALQRIDGERQFLEIDLDLVDRVLRERLRLGGDREDRLADEHRLVCENRLGRRRLGRDVARAQNAEHARHRERLGRVDVADPRVRHRAQHQPAVNHAFGAEVLGVLSLAGDLAVDVGRDEILAQQLVGHRANPPRREHCAGK